MSSLTRPGAQRGFALLYVLGLLTILALVITGLSEQYQTRLGLAKFFKASAAEQLEIEKQFAQIQYQLTDSKVTRSGYQALNNHGFGLPALLPTDNREIAANGYRIRIQDSSGLIGISWSNDYSLKRALGLFNVPQQAINKIAAQWLDYIDTDQQARHLGGEQQAGLPLRNGTAIALSEFLNMPDVAKLPASIRFQLATRLTLDTPPGTSIYTVSPEVLHVVRGVSLPAAREFVRAIRQNPNVDPATVLGGSWTSDPFVAISRPSEHLRICLLRKYYSLWECRVYDFDPFDYRAGVQQVDEFQLPSSAFGSD